MADTRDEDRQQLLSHLTLENSPVALFLVGRDGRFFRVNAAACRLTGYDRDELLDSIAVTDIDPDFTGDRFDQLFEGKDPDAVFHFESTCARKGGTQVPVLVHMNLVEFEKRQYSCTFVQDISERKQAERELERLKDRLEEENICLQEEIKLTHSFGEIGPVKDHQLNCASISRIAGKIL